MKKMLASIFIAAGLLAAPVMAEEAKPETKDKDKNKTKTKEPLKSEKEVISQESLFKDLQLKSAVDVIKVLAIKK